MTQVFQGRSFLKEKDFSRAEIEYLIDFSAHVKDLKKRGFKFVGSTIVYSFLQAIGIVDDHLISCPYKKSSK